MTGKGSRSLSSSDWNEKFDKNRHDLMDIRNEVTEGRASASKNTYIATFRLRVKGFSISISQIIIAFLKIRYNSSSYWTPIGITWMLEGQPS